MYNTTYSNMSLKVVKENVIIDKVKGCRQVKDNKAWGWVSIRGKLLMVNYFNKCSFSAVIQIVRIYI